MTNDGIISLESYKMTKTIKQINCPGELAVDDWQFLQNEIDNLNDSLDTDQLSDDISRDSRSNNRSSRQKSLFGPAEMAFGGWVMIAIVFFVAMMSILPFLLSKEEMPLPNFSIKQNSELPGEEVIRGGSSDTELVATVTDQVDAKEDDTLGFRYHGSNNIWIRFDNDKAGSKSAKLTTTIIREGQEPEVQNTLYPYIKVDDLPYGETKFTIIAENVAGKVEKLLTITKTTHRAACDASPANQTHKYCKHFYKTDDKPVPTLPNYSGSGCIHYEAGRCWDEIEDEAYENGRWDRDFGSYGGGYNPPNDCTGICEDIYDEAYTQGYWE